MKFGEKLANLRREKNYTQEQLAELLEVSRQSVSKWESDIAYPETEKLIKIGELFDCSMDYLLKEEVSERSGVQAAKEAESAKPSAWARFKNAVCKERKSKTTVFGLPLYHIGRNAKGFFAVGLKAKGVFSLGLLSKGGVSFGLLSIGVISVGVLSLGALALGTFALGAFAVGSIALGLVAVGAIAIGLISFGALSIGLFSSGALAIGKYVAVGDHARAILAIGTSQANGRVYSHLGDRTTADIAFVKQWLDANVPAILSWAKGIFKFYLSY